MDSPSKYKSTISFVDLLFNVLLGFVFLFIVAFVLINPIAKRADVDMPAQYMIVLTWPDSSDNDMDLWVMDPNGNRVGFNERESGFMNLDRDDIGTLSDIATVNGEVVEVRLNREVVTLRGIVPGTYYVTVHLYAKRDADPIEVAVEVIKLNPYSVIYSQKKIMEYFGHRENFYKFTLTESGNYYGVESTNQSAMK